ncbi:arginase family protein [Nonomuraea sp. NPDC048916]|uniref:arginase family protein n=1 Tax=Nonomuraea sp. NPDC048916 TaxID=3154232 RepID=UPI0033C2516A
MDAVIEQWRGSPGDGTGAIYVTVDVDVLELGYATGTGAATPATPATPAGPAATGSTASAACCATPTSGRCSSFRG